MLDLEADRLARLGLPADRSHGLIVPVVLRGAKHLPDEIRNFRQYYDFESFQLGGRRLSRHPKFAPAIRDIAGYVCDRYDELLRLPADAFNAVRHFRLPGEDQVRPFLATAATFRLPFPSGGEACVTRPVLTAP